MQLLESPFYYAVLCVPCTLKGLPFSVSQVQLMITDTSWMKKREHNKNYHKPHFFSFCFMAPQYYQQSTRRIIYFLVQVVPICIRLISECQKKSSDQLCDQTQKKSLSAHCEAANGPEIPGDSFTVIENYPIT